VPRRQRRVEVRVDSGQVVERFAPDVPPDAPMIVAAVERDLGASAT